MTRKPVDQDDQDDQDDQEARRPGRPSTRMTRKPVDQDDQEARRPTLTRASTCPVDAAARRLRRNDLFIGIPCRNTAETVALQRSSRFSRFSGTPFRKLPPARITVDSRNDWLYSESSFLLSDPGPFLPGENFTREIANPAGLLQGSNRTSINQDQSADLG